MSENISKCLSSKLCMLKTRNYAHATRKNDNYLGKYSYIYSHAQSVNKISKQNQSGRTCTDIFNICPHQPITALLAPVAHSLLLKHNFDRVKRTS